MLCVGYFLWLNALDFYILELISEQSEKNLFSFLFGLKVFYKLCAESLQKIVYCLK